MNTNMYVFLLLEECTCNRKPISSSTNLKIKYVGGIFSKILLFTFGCFFQSTKTMLKSVKSGNAFRSKNHTGTR